MNNCIITFIAQAACNDQWSNRILIQLLLIINKTGLKLKTTQSLTQQLDE